jgi:hypothetical protein
MRRHTVALMVLGLAMSGAHMAQAKQGCPTLTDAAGDTGAFGYHVQDDATDITAVKVSTNKKLLTAALTVVGKPVADEQGVARRFEVYLETAEQGDYVLRGTIGNGQSRFQLVTHQATETPQGSTVNEWQRGKAIEGRVSGNTVTITAPLDQDLPLLGQKVQVSATTWISDGLSVAGAAEGASVGVDKAGTRAFRVGDRGCA